MHDNYWMQRCIAVRTTYPNLPSRIWLHDRPSMTINVCNNSLLNPQRQLRRLHPLPDHILCTASPQWAALISAHSNLHTVIHTEPFQSPKCWMDALGKLTYNRCGGNLWRLFCPLLSVGEAKDRRLPLRGLKGACTLSSSSLACCPDATSSLP